MAGIGDVESAVPGRTRLRLKPELRTPEAMARVQDRLKDHQDVDNVSINPRTGSVVVTHARHRRGHEIAAEALREIEFVSAAVLDLPEDEDEGAGGRFGKIDQQMANLLYRVDYAVWRRTGLHFRGQIVAGSVAGLGVAQIILFGISLEMLPGPLLLWIGWDIYHRVSQEPPFTVDGDAAAAAGGDADAAPAAAPGSGGDALAPATA